jgi:hypothetical protein
MRQREKKTLEGQRQDEVSDRAFPLRATAGPALLSLTLLSPSLLQAFSSILSLSISPAFNYFTKPPPWRSPISNPPLLSRKLLPMRQWTSIWIWTLAWRCPNQSRLNL